jgi:hypothetical protein
MAERQAAPGQDEAAESERKGEDHAGRHQSPPATRRQVHVLTSKEIGAGVARTCVGRDR